MARDLRLWALSKRNGKRDGSMNMCTRKDVAQLLTVSADQVRRNEKRWGLDQARVDLNRRCVRYSTSRMMRILRARGFVE